MRSLRDTLMSFDDIDRAIVVFDTGRSARRKSLYPEYKANRKQMDEVDANGWSYMDNFNAQIRILRFLLPKLGVRIVTLPYREGDDVLALIPSLLNSILTIIATDDKDMLQLVEQNVHVWRPIAKELITPEEFELTTGCRQEHFLLWKSVVGDAGDNIIGVKGVGKKTMGKFLEGCPDIGEYPFDNFFEYLLELDNKRADDIVDNVERVLLNYELIDLRQEEFSEDDKNAVRAVCTEPLKLDVVAARRALTALEYFSLMDDFNRWVVRFQVLR